MLAPAPRLATPEELPAAISLLLLVQPPHERAARLARALQLLRDDSLVFHVWVLYRQGRLIGALNCQPAAGAIGLLWPPVVAPPFGDEEQGQLIRQACQWLYAQGAQLVQCLLAEQDRHLASPLLNHGFDHITTLSMLCCDLQSSLPQLHWPNGITVHSYTDDQQADWLDIVERSYQDALDVPEINGVRPIATVIEGYRQTGRFDPDRWLLLRRQGEPVAVLLLSELLDGEWEISYLGVVPSARRQKLASLLLCRGLTLAHSKGASRVSLAVDDRNQPAWQLYLRHGFRIQERKHLYLWLPVEPCRL